jgi:ATP-dependent helicase/nuclease subunit B
MIPSQPLEPSALFARLAEGRAAATTVLTPNARLARALEAEVDRRQLAAGRLSWEAPDILTFGDFVRRCHEDALYGDAGAGLPALLSTAESQILWEDALQALGWQERVLSVPATAALAREAWDLAHAWRIEGAIGAAQGVPDAPALSAESEDVQAFAAWCAHYRRRTRRENLVDAARLPALVAAGFASGAARAPAAIVIHAFDLLTPQQQDFLAACERAGARLERSAAPRVRSDVRRALLDSPRAELEHAARWARDRLERAAGSAPPRIAVVVPQLAERRAEVARVFARLLEPAGPAAGGPRFNISLGMPLAGYPLVDAALDVLELCAAPLAFGRVSRLLRSPFVAGGEAERGARARLDAALRRIAPATLSLHRLRALAPEAAARRGAPCPGWLALLDRLAAACRDDGRASAPEWARRFTTLLDAAGFPGDRALDSTEFQALAKWRETLAAFGALGSVSPAWTANDARARLRRLCLDATFQPASGEAPVQVLGILESAGLAFDHLWVSGLTEEAWPLAARPHPFIAPALQRRAGIPQASAERSLEIDAALTDAWRCAAPEVVFTSARADGDRELLPSPLVAGIAETGVEALSIPRYSTRRGALFAAGRAPGAAGVRADTLAPALGAASSFGGTAVLADQAACPFRAFAHFRLDARALETPEPGLDPPERGELLHAMMARLWGTLGDQAALKAADDARLAAVIEEAAAHAVAQLRAKRPGRLEGRFAQLERERLARLAREWLELEKKRAPFEVLKREEAMVLGAGNLRLSGRVDRMDRLLDGGGLAVIDYKSGRASVSDWLGPRPDDAQLPLYALAVDEDELRAVAFARLKVGEMGFAGLARDKAALPDVPTVEKHRGAKAVGSWTQLLARWREEVDALGENFASGDARIDPKHALDTCRRCDLRTLCRVHERFGALAERDGAGEEDE